MSNTALLARMQFAAPPSSWWCPPPPPLHLSSSARTTTTTTTTTSASISTGTGTGTVGTGATRPRVSVRPMQKDDVPRMLTILNEAAEGGVSAKNLEVYTREASMALPEEQVALVAEASTSSSPLETPTTQVVGLVGLLLADELKPPEMKLDGLGAGYVTNLAARERGGVQYTDVPWLQVAQQWRGEGVGAALLLAAEDASAAAGCACVACRVDETNVVARSMYSKRGYDDLPLVVEPKKLVEFRELMGTLYGFAGLAHAADLLAGPSQLAMNAGAPAFANMDATQKALALGWCAMGPLAAAAGRVGAGPKVAAAGLVAYGTYEVALAVSCAAAFGAAGGDAVTGAVAVQAVVFGCYQFLSLKSSSGGRLSLGKILPLGVGGVGGGGGGGDTA